jgi:hypothetical protein
MNKVNMIWMTTITTSRALVGLPIVSPLTSRRRLPYMACKISPAELMRRRHVLSLSGTLRHASWLVLLLLLLLRSAFFIKQRA